MQTTTPASRTAPIQAILSALREQRLTDASDLLMRHAPTLSAAELGSVGMLLGAIADEQTPQLELVLMSSSQPMNLANLLHASFAASGLRAVVRDTGYDQWRFVLREPQNSAPIGATRLYLCLLDATIAYPRMALDSDLDRLERVLGTVSEELEDAVRHTEKTGSILVLNTVPVPMEQLDVLLDFRSRARAVRLWYSFNIRLLNLVETFPHLQVLDAAHILQNKVPHGRFWDARMATLAGVQWTPNAMLAFANAYVRTARAVLGQARKCLVLDLDNTLWGGILGDDGIDGVEIQEGTHGNAHARLQQASAALGCQGVILAVNSKNEQELVEQCFAQRAMPLTRTDFALVLANWQPKHDNLREIVRSLNIFEDAVVFVDDSPFECDLVRESLPGVHVVEIGEEPANAVELLLCSGMFDRVSVTDDDRARNRSYANEAKRTKMRSDTQDYSEYLRRLKLAVSVRPLEPRDVQRAAQLSQRTNQFNLTGQRFSEVDLGQRVESSDSMDLLFSVQDRFGDYGIAGAVFGRCEGRTLHIENMVLSCRVFSRGIEHYMLAKVAERAVRQGCETIRSCYIKSAKNRQFSVFHDQCGFDPVAAESPGEWFSLPLSRRPQAPAWISSLNQ